jgi:hypothetical protein
VGYLPSSLRLPPVDIAGETQRRLSNSLRQFAGLPIELTPARMLLSISRRCAFASAIQTV